MAVSLHLVDLGTLARVGTALADPTRRRVLVHLISRPGYPAKMAEDFGTGRANLSNHLTCLRECGLVTATAEGRRVRYGLADERITTAGDRPARAATLVFGTDFCEGANPPSHSSWKWPLRRSPRLHDTMFYQGICEGWQGCEAGQSRRQRSRVRCLSRQYVRVLKRLNDPLRWWALMDGDDPFSNGTMTTRPTVNSASPAVTTRRRPDRSPRAAPVSSRSAKVSV